MSLFSVFHFSAHILQSVHSYFPRFPLEALTLVIIIIQNPPAESSNIYVISKSESLDCFVIYFLLAFWVVSSLMIDCQTSYVG